MANDAEAKIRISAENRTREAFDEVRRSIVSVDESAGKLGDVFRALLVLEGAREFARELVRAGVEGEQSSNRLTATLRATGQQVGLTRKELDELAESLAESTTFDDDGIRNAQS